MLVWMITRGWLLFIPLIAIAIIAVVSKDVRWAIVAVTYLLVCIPMILTPVVFNQILTPKARRQLALKTVEFDSAKNVIISFYDMDEENDRFVLTDRETIPNSGIKGVFHLFSTTVVWLKSSGIELILIPD